MDKEWSNHHLEPKKHFTLLTYGCLNTAGKGYLPGQCEREYSVIVRTFCLNCCYNEVFF